MGLGQYGEPILLEALDQLEYTTITSPIDGTITVGGYTATQRLVLIR